MSRALVAVSGIRVETMRHGHAYFAREMIQMKRLDGNGCDDENDSGQLFLPWVPHKSANWDQESLYQEIVEATAGWFDPHIE